MKKVLTFIVLILLLVAQGQAQLFKFTFDGAYVSPGQGNSVTVQHAQISSVIRNGSGLNPTAGDEVFNTSGWNQSTQGAQYLSITITADPGYKVKINSLGLGAWSTTTGPSNGNIIIEKGGTVVTPSALSFSPKTGSTSAPSSLPSFPFDVSSLNIQSEVEGTLTIKIYAWGSASGGNMRIDNFYINGTIDPQSIIGSAGLQEVTTNGSVTTNSITTAGLIVDNGSIGIGTGTTAPTQKLEVVGNTLIKSGTLLIGDNISNVNSLAADYKLAVQGTALFYKIKVLKSTSWPDYVFDKDYKLRTIDDLEKFVSENKHLPNVPSATDITKDGIDVGNNQAALLEKIEELTLYIIQQNKEIVKQNERIEKLEQIIKTQNK